jgi:D-alanyl-D-alanine carboxypeptidase
VAGGVVSRAGRVKDKRYPAQLVTVPHGRAGKTVELTPQTAKAYEALLAHARGAGFNYPLFSIQSAWRSDEKQAGLSKKAEKRYGDKSRKWVAKPGGSAHRTGQAIDFYLGLECNSSNVEKIAETAAYKWLKENAPNFGFVPYSAEPWHWEFNPVIEDEEDEGE